MKKIFISLLCSLMVFASIHPVYANTDKAELYNLLQEELPECMGTLLEYNTAIEDGQIVYDDANATQSAVDAAIKAIHTAKLGLHLKNMVTASSSVVEIYEDNVPNRACDGNLDTSFWTSRSQKNGDSITLTFREPITLNKVRFYVIDGDFLRNAVLKVSTDGTSFTQVATLEHSSDFTITLDNVQNVKAMQMICTEDFSPNWWKLTEIIINDGLKDTASLQFELDKVVYEEDYTPNSYANYVNQKTNALAVYNNASASASDVNTATNNLKNAINNLEKADGSDIIFAGAGTQADPYLIQTPADLVKLSELSNKDDSYNTLNYKLTADLNMRGITFKPIGKEFMFKGVIDGDGHILENLTIQNDEGYENTGLVSFLYQGTIKNLGIESGTITGASKVGAFAGRTMYANIINCYSKADVTGVNDVAGLVGMFNNSTLANCFAWGTITGTKSVAGLTGSANASIDPSYPAYIKNCYVNVTIKASENGAQLSGWDEAPYGFPLTWENLYYLEGKVGIANNPDRDGIYGISQAAFTNGELLAKLNANVAEGYTTWVVGDETYPEFRVTLNANGLSGKGTEDNPYRIYTAEDLVKMQTIIAEDSEYSDDYYALYQDIDMNEVTYTPIQNFKGTFDGKLHKILNLTINDTTGQPAGLFGSVVDGTILNVGVESGSITGTNRVGALVGRSDNMTMRNCYSKASVTGSNDIGGLVGMFNNSTMENCFARATVSGNESVGGLAGSANRSVNLALGATIKNCYSVSNVSAARFAGTLIGFDESGAGEQYKLTFEQLYCDATQTAIGNHTRSEVVLVPSADITNGTLVTTLNQNAQEGYAQWLEDNTGYPAFEGKVVIKTSLVGEGSEASPYLIQNANDLVEMARVVDLSAEFAQAYYKMTANIDLYNVEFNGISSVLPFKGTFDGAGHIVENVNIYEKGSDMTGFFHSSEGATIKNFGIESGIIRGRRYVGSIVGRTMTTTILNCYNNATVRGIEDVGGLVGMLNNSDLLNSYNSGEVIATKSMGGLAGSICESLNPSIDTNVINSYNIGHVHWGTYSGKVVGYAEKEDYLATYTNVYYNKQDVPNMSNGTYVTLNATGLNKADLMSESFVTTMNNGRNEGYANWVLGSDDIVRLEMFEDAKELQMFMKSISDQPQMADGKVVLPVSESGRYVAILAGSTNQQVVGLDGTIYQPLTDQSVSLIYDIKDTLHNNDIVARLDRNVVLTVNGIYDNAGVNPMPNVVPGLREWYGLEGNFVIDANTTIIADNDVEKEAAAKIKEYLDGVTEFDIAISENDAEAGDIILTFDETTANELGEEGYYVSIADQIEIKAATPIALLYGGISVAQILYQDEMHTNVPKGIIRDYPQYPMRGGMMDVARKYFELDYIEEVGKYMAWFKMNTFHLHINEDSGLGGEYSSSFVVESKKYPQLNTYNKGYIWSQEDYKQMQKNLKEYGVQVVTEIDTPGHATIFDLIKPEIVSGSNFDLANHYDECLALISDVFDEFLDGDDPVFQSATVHIGTDESGNSNENMRRYINDLAQYCLSKDNVDDVMFWGNLSVYPGETSIDSDHVINQVWDSADQRVEEALLDGFDIINSTSNSMYIIPGNGNWLHNGYVDMASFYNTWEGTIDFDTNTVSNPTWIANRNYYADYELLKGNPQILGTIFCNWNDRSWGNDYDILDLVLSYIGVISEKCWYGDENRFDAGKDFVTAFNKVGDYAPNANPRRIVDTDSSIIAQYDFEEINENIVSDVANDFDAVVSNMTTQSMDENYMYGKAAVLNTDSMMSLPFDGVGYPYTVNFDLYLNGAQDANAILFKDGNATFYLDYQNKGVGYQIGKYGFTYNVSLPQDEWVNVTLTSTYVHGSTATTVLKVNGNVYSPSLIVHPSSVSAHSSTSYLGTSEMFTNINGYLDNVVIGNKYNQSLTGAIQYEFEGEGSEASPYLISTPKELEMFSRVVNIGDKMDAHFKLTKDIDMSGATYTTVAEFRGVFDGAGHVISNLTINETDKENVGLIGLLQGGTVKNLGLDNLVVNGKSRVGGIAGRTMYATIMNCYVNGSVSGEWDVALLVGMFNNSTMKNCYTWGTVNATNETAGGLVGGANRSIDSSVPCMIENCYSNATVSCPKYAGVLVGYDESIAGENYTIQMNHLYYVDGKTAVGNNPKATVTKLSSAAFSDGTLLNALNANVTDGCVAWVTGENGLPVFAEIAEAFGTVENLKAEAINYKTIQLSWDVVKDAESYIVERLTNEGEWIELATTNETTYIASGVKTGKEYTYRVKAVKGEEVSEAVEVKATTTLQGEVELTITPNGANQFDLSWTTVEGATRYIIYRKDGEGAWKKVLTLGKDETSYTSKAMKANTYQYQVKAARYDSVDRVMTNGSNIVEGIVGTETMVPTNVKVEADGTTVTLSFDKAVGMTYYEIYRSKDGGAYRQIKRTTDTTITSSGLKAGSTYQYKIRAFALVNGEKVYAPDVETESITIQ